MRAQDDLFTALARSAFRSRFKLGPKDRADLDAKGLDTILRHADDFIAAKLAPALPGNDGKQTPMHGHPVFVAQPGLSRQMAPHPARPGLEPG